MTQTCPNNSESPAFRSRWISRSLILYVVIGISGVLLDLCLFLLLFNVVGMHEQLSNAISVTVAVINNFTLNAVLNFRKRDRLLTRFLRFYAVGMTGIVLTFGLFQLFSTVFSVDPNIVKAASLPLVLLVQYSINKKWSFA